MKQHITLLSLLVPMVLIAGSGFAQVRQTAEQRKELLNRMLEEKHFHLPGKVWEADRDEHKAGAKTTVADQRVTSNSVSVDEGEVSVAYDPNDSNNVVISFMQQGSGGLGFPIYYSSNGGATWSLSNFNSSARLSADFPGSLAAGGGDPAFAWDKNGTIYYAWIYLSVKPPAFDTAFFTLNWAYSTDKGHTWSVRANHFIGRGAIDGMTGNTMDYMDGITDREWLAVDNSGGPHQGNVYCSFVNFPADISAPSFEAIKTLIPGIDTFGPMVPAYIGSTQFGNVEVDKTGVLHMSLADLDNGLVRHVASADGGVSFGTSQVVGAGLNMFPSAPFIVHNRENGAINMAVDGPAGSGHNVHVVWSDFPGGKVSSYYAHSTDGGLTWSATDTLNKHFGGKTTLMPTVAAFGNNVTISLTVVDSTDTANYYMLNSTNNGTSFDYSIQASTAPTNYAAIGAPDANSNLFFGDYNRSVRSQCVAYSSWSDGRNAQGAKVYFARKNFCTVGVQEITSVTAGVQLTNMFPNPASDKLTFDLSSDKTDAVTMELMDMTGKRLMTVQAQLTAGRQQLSMPLNGIARGAYVVTIKDNDGIIATRNVAVH